VCKHWPLSGPGFLLRDGLEVEIRKDQASFAAKSPTEMLLWGKLAALTDIFRNVA